VLIVCCLIVVPLPPGENPFAVNNNNNNKIATNCICTFGNQAYHSADTLAQNNHEILWRMYTRFIYQNYCAFGLVHHPLV
jgi:hypothetical protein